MPGVYISFPFCSQKCTYCNFASGVFPKQLEEDYLGALESELRTASWPWKPETVYIGGGTPSVLPADRLAWLLDAVPDRPWLEATIEAAPGTLTAAQTRGWRDAGVNRVSLGVQSFVDAELRRTGRRHDASIVESEVRLLCESGLPNFSIDLIAGLPGQTESGWLHSLDWIGRLEAPHVSVYMLEVDEDSRLGRELLLGGVKYGASDVPSESQIVSFYEQAVERLGSLGLRRYEISNFARPGYESEHNLKNWRLEPYLGFGADAHSFDGKVRWRNAETAAEYVELKRRGGSLRVESTESIAQEERFFVGLRLSEGIRPLHEDWIRYAGPIERFIEGGLMERSGDSLRLTPKGILLSNEVFGEFIQSCP